MKWRMLPACGFLLKEERKKNASWKLKPPGNLGHGKATIVLIAVKNARSPDFGNETDFGNEIGLRVAFASCRLVLGVIPLDGQPFLAR